MSENPNAAAPRPQDGRQVFQTLCRMCDDHCALNVYVEEGRIVDVDGFAAHPWNRGRLCSNCLLYTSPSPRDS